jgi:hypothetical protein
MARLGTRQLTVIPCGPSSRALNRVRPSTAVLAAAYAGDWWTAGSVIRAERDEMLTIFP